MNTVLAFLARNPLASGLGILAALLAVGLGVQTLRLSNAHAALAAEQLAFSDFKKDLAVQTAAAERANAERSSRKAQQLADDFMAITATAAQVKEALDAARSSGACERDPKWRSTVGGVRAVGQGSAGAAPGKADR